jgi:F-type H+-transporting ATPase subunit a
MADKTILHLLPGVEENLHRLGDTLGGAAPSLMGSHSVSMTPMFMLAVALTTLFVFVFIARRKLSKTEEAVIPDAKLTVRTFFELFFETLWGLMIGIMGEVNTRKFFPLIATCGVVIFFSNFLGLVPGMVPPTENLNLNLAMAVVIFITTHVVGIKTNGIAHVTHMANPVGTWWGWFLAPLMFPIEVISHLARPVSLGLRLMGNMIGDHKVLSIFMGLTFLIIPIPFLVLGTIVCTVQTAVFCLLSMVYIGLALEDLHQEAH